MWRLSQTKHDYVDCLEELQEMNSKWYNTSKMKKMKSGSYEKDVVVTDKIKNYYNSLSES